MTEFITDEKHEDTWKTTHQNKEGKTYERKNFLTAEKFRRIEDGEETHHLKISKGHYTKNGEPYYKQNLTVPVNPEIVETLFNAADKLKIFARQHTED